MEDFRAELLAAFAIEHREHLEVIRRLLDAAEAGQPIDLRDGFRRVHSLKGAARAVDLPAVEEVAHGLEAFFARLGDGTARLDGAAVAAVTAALDAVEGQVAALVEGRAEQLPAGVVAALEGLLARPPAPGEAAEEAGAGAALRTAAAAPDKSGPAPRDVTPPPEAAPAMVLPAPLAAGGFTPAATAGDEAVAQVEHATAPQPAQAATGAGEYLRVHASQVEVLSGAMHELSALLQRQDATGAALTRLEAALRALQKDWAILRPGLRGTGGETGGGPGPDGNRPDREGPARPDPRRERSGAGEPVRDGTGGKKPGRDAAHRFDEGLAAVTRDLAALRRDTGGTGWALAQAARQLRAAVDALSLVPAETVLGSLARTVRELARSEGYEVAVRLDGMEVQADRAVLQALRDPLLHLLRNAVGHGRQSPEERRAAGKPERGEVGLQVASRGGQLVLRVWDDGPGPDLARIESTAVRQGLLPARPAGGAPDSTPWAEDRLLEMVFEPGFSTAASVDRISGRGMGLSVVAEAVRALRGSVLLRPRQPEEPGNGGTEAGAGRHRGGTEVVVSVPFSASRQSVLLLEAGGRVFSLPGYGAERLLRLPPSALEDVGRYQAARLTLGDEEVLVPLVGLAALLGLGDGSGPDSGAVEAGIPAVLLRRGNRRCLLRVDRLRDVRTLLVGPLDVPGVDTELFAGVVMLDDATAAPLLRPEGLMERWMRLEAEGPSGLPARPAPRVAPRRQTTVLVVDDSITTRTLERSILEAQGYRVILAVDGLEALERLRGGDAVVDLVLADVEMPRMDGFGLLQAIKADASLAALPVILMTSRADAADVRRGLELGAGAYLTKQRFDGRELLATIGQLL